jgi:hypothetical protein
MRSLTILITQILAALTCSSAAAEELEPWETYVLCSLPAVMFEDEGGLWNRPVEALVCDKATSIEPPPVPLPNLKLTTDEFNTAFQAVAGVNFRNSVKEYDLSDYVRQHTACVDHANTNVIDADADFMQYAEPIFFDLISRSSSAILAEMSVEKFEYNTDLFLGSLTRILQIDSLLEPISLSNMQYESFAFLVEYRMRKNLLEYGEIWPKSSWINDSKLLCDNNGMDTYWYRLAAQRGVTNLGDLRLASIRYVEDHKDEAIEIIRQKIISRGRMEFFCGDPMDVLRERLRQEGHSFPHEPQPITLSYYAEAIVGFDDCSTWRDQYFEDAVEYLSESFKRANIQRPTYDYSSPFE